MKSSDVDMIALESAICDASRFAEIVSDWLAICIGFQNTKLPEIDPRSSSLIYWAVMEVSHKIREVERIYPGLETVAHAD